MSTKVKKKGTDLYQLVARMGANGGKQQQGIDIKFSYSPTAGAVPNIKVTLCLAVAANHWTLTIIDFVNLYAITLQSMVQSQTSKYQVGRISITGNTFTNC
jgi:hypothetical protein